MRGVLLGLVLAPLFAGPVAAMEYAAGVPGAEVGRLVRAAMAEAGEDVPDFADPMRAFPPCTTAPEVRPRQGSWATAEVACSAPVWSRAVRTGAAAPTRLATQPEEGDRMVVTLAPAGARSPEGIFTDPAQVIGRRTKAAIGEGRPVLLRQLEPVWMVAKGNPVVLVARAGGLAVSAPAEALEDGAMGDVIRVLNLSSQREVKVVVTGQNSVMAQTNMR